MVKSMTVSKSRKSFKDLLKQREITFSQSKQEH